jgi:hypothetical protein
VKWTDAGRCLATWITGDLEQPTFILAPI